jgi:hypothetical protein
MPPKKQTGGGKKTARGTRRAQWSKGAETNVYTRVGVIKRDTSSSASFYFIIYSIFKKILTYSF